jgi:Protein of unknown function (DUF1214)
MASEVGPADEALREAWNQFCVQLREAGEKVFKEANPGTPVLRADAFRFLTQNLGQAFDLALETKNTAYPLIHAFCTPTRKLGGDAADLSYRQAWIDGTHTYRITGKRGTARFLNVTVQGARPERNPVTGWPSLHEPFGDLPQANILGHQLECDADGSFELYVGGDPRGPNWLPTTPATRKLFIREGFDAWEETPTPLTIERLGMDSPRPMPTAENMIAAMTWAGDFLTSMMCDWPEHPYQYSGGVVDPSLPNQFPPERSANTVDDVRRGRLAAHMVWELEPDEALVVTFDAHDGFWMVSLGGVFMNSFDYLYRPVSYTPARTRVDTDGKVRLVLAHEDPGYHNWLDTQAFERGNLTYRNLLSQTPTTFHTQLVKQSSLNDAMPDGCARLTRQGRVEHMRERFHAVRRRYGL